MGTPPPPPAAPPPPSVVEIIELPVDPSPPAPQQQPPARAKVKLYVATPCFGCQMSSVFLASVLNLQAAAAVRGYECFVDFIGNESLVERARNILAARFLESDATHLLFIDADIGFQAQSVFRLVDSDKDVSTAVYPKKSQDWDLIRRKLAAGDKEPVHQMGLDFNINIASGKESVDADGFVRVLDSATGFMLIKRGVLERMAAHYREELHCVNDIPGQTVKSYVALFACMIDEGSRRFLSEDYSFCRRYQKLGGEIWADLASPLAHIGTHIFAGDIRQRAAARQQESASSPLNPARHWAGWK